MWKPIETAPKATEEYGDPSPNMIVCAEERGDLRIGEAYNKLETDWSSDDEPLVLTWWWANDSCSCCHYEMNPPPTHWMPLPEPPSTQTEGET